MAAQSLAGGDSASQRPATEQQLQPQQQQLATIMVQAPSSMTSAQVAADVLAAAGMSAGIVVYAHTVVSKQSTSSYCDAVAAVPDNNSSSRGKAASGSGSGQGGAGNGGSSSSGVQTRGMLRSTSSSSKGISSTAVGVKAAKGSPSQPHADAGSSSNAATTPVNSDGGGKSWHKVQLASAYYATQLLRKRTAAKQAGFRVEEALSKDELAVKARYLRLGIPATVWETERVPVSWRRGRLVKLVMPDGREKGRWEVVPLSYTPPTHK